MTHNSPLQWLIVLIIFSFVLSSAAVPTTRSLLSNTEKSSFQATLVEGALEFRNERKMLVVEEELMVKERMVLESSDYPGTGANNRHDPKTPERA
ncbi:hypothetical protein RIF29_19641 [Crotalaria pallida]|uniref:Uncharacterized protein n=1 Tax=Crotalaria pallida TaxID=3830 RepID=A0AAN9I6P6_CROPI